MLNPQQRPHLRVVLPYQEPEHTERYDRNPTGLCVSIIAVAFMAFIALGFLLWAINPDSWQTMPVKIHAN